MRVAYAISKPFGSAVRRNRARRRLRSAVGMVADQARAGAYLVSAEPEVLQMEFSELVGLVRDAMMGAAAGGIVPPTTVLGTGGAS